MKSGAQWPMQPPRFPNQPPAGQSPSGSPNRPVHHRERLPPPKSQILFLLCKSKPRHPQQARTSSCWSASAFYSWFCWELRSGFPASSADRRASSRSPRSPLCISDKKVRCTWFETGLPCANGAAQGARAPPTRCPTAAAYGDASINAVNFEICLDRAPISTALRSTSPTSPTTNSNPLPQPSAAPPRPYESRSIPAP